MGYYGGSDRYDREGNWRDRDDRNQRGYGYNQDRSRAGYGYGSGYGRNEARYQDRSRSYGSEGSYGPSRRPPGDYDYEDRGFFDRAGDEVRSWFGDEEAERRRNWDSYYNRQYGDPRDQSSRVGFAGGYPTDGYVPFSGQQSGYAPESRRQDSRWVRSEDSRHDHDYHAWRDSRMAELDRDYHEYRQENRARFNREFDDWRTRRTSQRGLISQVQEHQEVVGSDGEHVGTVDKVAGDRLILTKTDKDAGGHHHSIPSRWIDKIEAGQVVLEKTADQAKQAWREADDNQALFGDDRGQSGAHYLNRSFSGTY